MYSPINKNFVKISYSEKVQGVQAPAYPPPNFRPYVSVIFLKHLKIFFYFVNNEDIKYEIHF